MPRLMKSLKPLFRSMILFPSRQVTIFLLIHLKINEKNLISPSPKAMIFLTRWRSNPATLAKELMELADAYYYGHGETLQRLLGGLAFV